jgi:hypothetical protein
MINVDKDWRHPFRSRRQSSKELKIENLYVKHSNSKMLDNYLSRIVETGPN